MRYSIILFLLPLFLYGQINSNGTAIDQNGNSFEWINYGAEDWSIENAEVVTYRDGTSIPQVTDDEEWFNLTTGAWCYYNNDSSNSKLYNAYAIFGKHDNDPNTPNKEFAPEGWSVPTNENWDYLLSSIGMEYSLFSLPHGQMSTGNEGSKLAGIENLWFNNPNNCSGGQNGTDGTLIDNIEFNSSGFNWTPGGYRSGAWSGINPSFCLINEWGHLWSITSDGFYFYRLSVTHNFTGLSQTVGLNTYGLNVRFVRDALVSSTENCAGSSGNQLVNSSFEIPIQPIIGNNFLTWPIDGWDGFGAIPNIVRTNGGPSTGGPNNAQSGVQYLDIVGSEADFYQEFEFNCNTQVFFSGYFSVRDNISSTGRIDLLLVNNDNTTSLIASSNQLIMPSTPNIWYLASGSTVLQPGNYRFNITMGENSNFDNACFSFDNINIDTGSYGPLCENSIIILTGLPTDSFGSWSGSGITDNGDGTASFNSSGLGGTIVTATYDYYDEFGIGCTQTTDIIINSFGAPSITDPISDYQLCDNDGDGSETFDLTSKYDEIVNTLTDITLTYYNTEEDANTDTNAIVTPSAYISSGTETIWVRAINTEGCISVGFFNLIIDTVPLFTEVPLFQICDDTTPDGFTEFDLDSLTPTIVAGASNLTVSYYLTEIDAEAGTVSPLSSPYTNTINPELIWARVEDDITGCYGTFVIELNVISPLAGTPTPLIECDQTPNDGIAEFNLTEADTDIINGQTNNLVTYHETLAQAEAGTDALVSPYTNTVPNIQTIFARLEEDVLGCYDVTQLVLQVDPAPSITDPISDYQLCDNDGDGSETFDLTSKYDEIVNTLTDITLTYYNTEADANTDTNAIAIPESYSIEGAETIWISAINTEGCISVGFFNLIIDTVPLFTEVPLFQICDDTTPDGFTEFDLDSLTPTIVAGASNLTVSYYLTEIDAEAGTVSPLSSPYTNTINPEFIWARVEDDIAGCYGTFAIELNVISLIAGTPTPLIECDQTPNDGIADFNLTEADTDIINGQTNNLVTYHETLAQAEAGTDALVSPYTNTVPNIQTIFARLEEDVLGCYDVTQLVLQVDPAPSITDPISDYQLCDNDGDGSETFDLTSKYDEIVNTLTDITLTYYNTEADANADTNAIVTPSAYISSGTETIWVRLSDNFTQCYTIGNFQIETIFCPLPDATVSINNDLYACRNRDLIIEYRVNNIDGTAILPAFTPISIYLGEILLAETQTLNDIPINGTETNSIEINLPINTPNLFEILIRVDDLGFNEGIIEELDELNNEYSVSIEFGSLSPILPLSNLIECDEGNESANFNLTQQNNSISTNTNDIITFYVSEEDAILSENEITDTGSYQNTSNPQTIYIRLENEICFTTSSFEIETENCIPFIPEGFSPNNDNINDVFEIDHLLNVYLDFELKIFSRHGNIIYKGTHKDGFWDGISNEGITFKHQLVPTGVYIYVLQLNDYRYPDSFIGTFYINY